MREAVKAHAGESEQEGVALHLNALFVHSSLLPTSSPWKEASTSVQSQAGRLISIRLLVRYAMQLSAARALADTLKSCRMYQIFSYIPRR